MLKVGDKIEIPIHLRERCKHNMHKTSDYKYIYITDLSLRIKYDIINENDKKIGECWGSNEQSEYCLSRNILEILKRQQATTNITKNKITTFMNELSNKVAMVFKSEPEKSFIKHGVTDMNGKFTEEGQAVFMQFLLKEYGINFKTEVLDLIVDEKK